MPKYARLRSNGVEYSRIKQIYSKQVIRVSNVSAHRNPQPRTSSSCGSSSTGFCARVMVIPQLSMVSEAVFHVPALLECILFSHLWNIMQHHVIIYNICIVRLAGHTPIQEPSSQCLGSERSCKAPFSKGYGAAKVGSKLPTLVGFDRAIWPHVRKIIFVNPWLHGLLRESEVARRAIHTGERAQG